MLSPPPITATQGLRPNFSIICLGTCIFHDNFLNFGIFAFRITLKKYFLTFESGKKKFSKIYLFIFFANFPKNGQTSIFQLKNHNSKGILF